MGEPAEPAKAEATQAERDLRFLIDLGDEAQRLESASALFARVSERLGEYLGVSRCLFNEVNASAGEATIHHDYHPGSRSLVGTYPLVDMGEVFLTEGRAGRVVAISDAATDARLVAELRDRMVVIGIVACVVVPLLREGRWVATLWVSDARPRVWEPREVALIQMVAERAWLWIERLRMVNALRMSEAKYRDLYDNAPDLYAYIKTPEGIIQDCNRAFTEALGYTKEEVVGRHILEFYDTTSLRARTEEDTDRRFGQRGYLSGQERRLLRRDGSGVDVILSASAVYDGDAIVGSRAVWRDIGARKQIERDQALLSELSEDMRSSANADELLDRVAFCLGEHLFVARCFFAEIDVARDLSIVRWEHCRGVPETRGSYPLSLFSEETRRSLAEGKMVVIQDASQDPRVAPVFRSAYLPRQAIAYLAIPLMREGVWSALLWVGDTQPRVWAPRELALAQEIGDRAWLWVEHLRMMRALQESEAKYRRIVETAQEGIWEIDASDRTAFVNRRAAEMLGYTPAEMLGRHLFSFMDEEWRAIAEEKLHQRRRGASESHEFKFQRRDGSALWTRVEAGPVFSESGQYLGSNAMLSDITDQRAAERELRSSLREKEVLLKEIHHRVRNNLQVISSLLSLQAQRLTDPESRRMFTESQARVKSIALVHERLYQSKQLSHVDFEEYARALVDGLIHSMNAAARGISPVLEISDARLPVDLAIPCGLIINELVTNSLKHAFPNGREGRILVRLSRDPSGLYQLLVSDDGVGFPDGLDLHQTDSLGLDLVFTFAEQLEAKVSVGRHGGASFCFSFAGGV